MDNNRMKNPISNVMTRLNNIVDIQISYDKRKADALDKYRNRELEDTLSTIREETKTAAVSEAAWIQASLDSLLREVQAANDYDVTTSAVADAAKLLSAQDVSFKTAEAVVSKFIGNQTALNLIAASATSADVKSAVDPWIFDNIGMVESIKRSANRFSWEPPENYPTLVSDVRTRLQNFAQLQGVDISSLKNTIEDIRIKNVTLLMGLSPDQL